MNAQTLFFKRNRRTAIVLATLLALLASTIVSAADGTAGTLITAEAAPAVPVRITRLSVSSSGEQGNGYSNAPSVSADGRYVVFESDATNLVAGDNNGTGDIFLRDRQTGTTSLVTLSSTGQQANDYSYWASISGDGRFVVFTSAATNLVNGGANGMENVFIRDRVAGITEMISVASDETLANDHSGAGISVSADGRYVVFDSGATNLVNGDTNEAGDVFLRDRQTGITTRISVASDGTEANSGAWGPSISSDGRYVVFNSGSDNLVPNDTNECSDVFVHDNLTGTTVRASVNPAGEQANRYSRSGSISGNGRYVAFMSGATNLTSEDTYYYEHIYIHDLQTGETTPITTNSDGSMLVGESDDPVISEDGRYVAFTFDEKGDGMPGMDIYLRDRQSSQPVSVTGTQPYYDESSFHPDISGNGNIIVFASGSDSLVPNDTNESYDVFARDMTPIVPITVTFKSIAAADGWIMESAENTSVGLLFNRLATVIQVGDDVRDRQYRSLLSFNTITLPDNAVILSAQLNVIKQGVVGTNPFTTHGALLVEIRAGTFSDNLLLQASDFSAAASPGSSLETLLEATPTRYTVNLGDTNLAFINKVGVTQFRLRFALDDNDDMGNDYLKFFSGNSTDANRPALIITYYLP